MPRFKAPKRWDAIEYFKWLSEFSLVEEFPDFQMFKLSTNYQPTDDRYFDPQCERTLSELGYTGV